MKNLFLCLLLLGPAALSFAADAADAAALAAQQDAEERYKRLAADVQTVLETQEMLQKRQDDVRQRIGKLEDEIRSLKEEVSRSSGNLVTREELKKYAEKLKEVDDKREADRKLILENIKELGKTITAQPAASEARGSSKHAPAESSEEMPFVYTVKKNDRLLDIISAYNEYFQKHGQPKITKEDVLKANPSLKPDMLRTGQKIKIPILGKEKNNKQAD
jgi:TolA-binding protein